MEMSKAELIKNLEEFKKKELLDELKRRGIDAKEKDTKAQLLDRLADSILAEEKKTPVTLRFIPYFTFANRGSSDLLVWLRRL